jgi:N,N'-diacetyllegionaminate synthase
MKSQKVIIIAEAGVNHNGDMQLAKRLIEVAAEAGADFVKFQTFKADKLVSKKAKKAAYQNKNIGGEEDSQYSMLKNLELSHENHLELVSHCRNQNIYFFSTAFDVDGVQYLAGLDLAVFKSPSGEITNFPYLRELAKTGKPIILSTGMASLGEIEDALRVLMENGCKRERITVLHCNTEYPTPMEDVNLKAMNTIRNAFGVAVGYSDHTLGIEVPVAAVALGATVIEKHFTLDRNLPGPDHKASLEPAELKAMVTAIRNTELAIIGSGRKEPSNSELKNKEIVRKSLHMAKNLSKGDIITEQALIPLRPGNGISPMEWENILGRRLKVDKASFEMLHWTDLA